MFKKIINKINNVEMALKTNNKNNDKVEKVEIPNSLDETKKRLQELFSNCNDFIYREIYFGSESQFRIMIAYMGGMSVKEAISEQILKPIMVELKESNVGTKINDENIIEVLKNNLLISSELDEIDDFNKSVESILCGDTVIYCHGKNKAIKVDVKGWSGRNVGEPATEAVVRGPREGFVETLMINIALIRRKVKNTNLKFEILNLGRQTKTNICIAYIKGIADEEIIKEVKDRLSKIDIDAVLESGYIETLIEDNPFSLFPTVGNSEKPDIVSAKILEGRVAILVEGTPFTLTVPYLLIEAFQNSEDYYSRPVYSSFIRILRWIAFFVSVTLPSIYVAFVTYHPELIPTPLLISIAGAQEGTPFPTFVEALVMQIIYEILREAGVRLPKPVGQAVSIVGALVIGEASVSAGLIGAPMVVIVALTAITSFTVPSLSDVNAILRLILVFVASVSGIYGIVLVFGIIMFHLCSLRSFGVNYTSPIAPRIYSDLKDTFIRLPWYAMLNRPRCLNGGNDKRMKFGQIPKPIFKKKQEN